MYEEDSGILAVFSLLGLGLFLFILYWAFFRNKGIKNVPSKFPGDWRRLLEANVHFYQNLNQAEKKRYEKKILSFLRQVRVIGVKVEIDDLDRLLVASSAVIPLFSFAGWKYRNLNEVIIYPSAFDREFSMDNPKETILGMVGSGGAMDKVMLLSKQSLRAGYSNPDDKHNVGIHEFVHVLDKSDGAVDGKFGALSTQEFAKPWLQLMHKEISKIKRGTSDIDGYAATNEQEFLAVTSEYFFERPKLLKEKHPDLYRILKKAYGQNMARRLRNPFKRRKKRSRNAPCLCGSGEKFKNCCLKE